MSAWVKLGEATLEQTGPDGTTATAMAVAPRLVDGRLYVPLRAISEALGARVTWHGEARTVVVRTD